jgi:hypothetical protein
MANYANGAPARARLDHKGCLPALVNRAKLVKVTERHFPPQHIAEYPFSEGADQPPFYPDLVGAGR